MFIKFHSEMYWRSNQGFSVPLMIQKVQKVDSVNIQSDCETTSKNRTDLSSVFTRSGKVRKGGDCHYTE